MSETDQEQQTLSELENKITAVLEERLSAATRNRDSLPERGFNPRFWAYQAEITSLIQQLNRRKNR